MANGKISIDNALKAVRLIDAINSFRRSSNAPSEREKFDWQQQMGLVKEQRQQAQYQMGQWMDMIKTMPTGPDRDHTVHLMEKHLNLFPQDIQQHLGLFLKHSPLSKTQRALREFDQMYPKPRINTEIDPEKDPYTAAQQRFAVEDYQWMRDRVQGIDRPFVEQIPITGELYGIREKGSKRIKIMNVAQEQLDEIGKGLPGTPTGAAIIANGGSWKRKEPYQIQNGADKILVTPMRNYLTGENWMQHEKIASDPTKAKPAPEGIVKFAGFHGADEEYDGKDEIGYMYNQFRELREVLTEQYKDANRATREALGQTIGLMYPNYKFRMLANEDVRSRWYWPFSSRGPKETLIYWPAGERVQLPGKNNTSWFCYLDPDTNWVYDGMGKVLGHSVTEAAAFVADKEGAVIGGE